MRYGEDRTAVPVMEIVNDEGTAVPSYVKPKLTRWKKAEKAERKNAGSTAKKFSRSGENNSVVQAKIIQSPTSGKQGRRPTEKNNDDDDDWRFEIKRKKRDAERKNAGSTAKKDWYYWVIRIRKSDGFVMYYGTLDILDESNPARLHKYWQRSKGRKK